VSSAQTKYSDSASLLSIVNNVLRKKTIHQCFDNSSIFWHTTKLTCEVCKVSVERFPDCWHCIRLVLGVVRVQVHIRRQKRRCAWLPDETVVVGVESNGCSVVYTMPRTRYRRRAPFMPQSNHDDHATYPGRVGFRHFDLATVSTVLTLGV
jgi:hypothetical protein